MNRGGLDFFNVCMFISFNEIFMKTYKVAGKRKIYKGKKDLSSTGCLENAKEYFRVFLNQPMTREGELDL